MPVTFEIPRTLEVGLISMDQKDLLPIAQSLKKVGLSKVFLFEELDRAVEFAKSRRDALLILDVRSRLEVGLEYLKDLKIDNDNHNFPVIPVVKAGDQSVVLTLLRDYGVSDVVTMPLQTTNLIQAISRTLAGFLPGELESQMRAVRAAIAAGQFDSAAGLLLRMSKRRKTVRTELGLSHISLEQNDLDGSRLYLEEAKGIEPGSFGVQITHLRQLLKERASLTVIEECLEAMVSHLAPPGRVVHILKTLYRSGRYAEALTLSVTFEPEFARDPSLKIWQAKFALKSSRVDSALQMLQKFHASGQRTFESLNMLGVIYKKKHNYPASIRAFEEACQMSPKDYRIYFNLGMAHEEMGDERKAVSFYQTACEMAPTFDKSRQRLDALLSRKKVG